MYVDEHGDDTSTTDATSGDELTVEIEGESYEVEENYDFDQDGENDAAVVQTEDGYIAFADTNGDGTADVAVKFDQDGNIVSGAEYNESTGEWTEEDPNKLPTPSGGGDTADDRDRDEDADTEQTGDSDSDAGGGITVETPSGEFDAGAAQYDSDGDGRKDTAVVTDEQGTTYAFTDADADGTADTAVVIEADGDVTVAENTGGDEWQVVEEGRLNEDGSYEAEPGTSAADSVWVESR